MSNYFYFIVSPCNEFGSFGSFEREIRSIMTVGERIKERRLKLGWTQDKLATEAKISTGFLSDLERGERNVSADYLLEISHALGVTLDFLMKGDSSTPKSGNVQIPASLSDFAKQAQLTFSQTLMLLDMQR